MRSGASLETKICFLGGIPARGLGTTDKEAVIVSLGKADIGIEAISGDNVVGIFGALAAKL